MEKIAKSPEPRRKKWWKLAIILVSTIVVLITALPWILNTPPARRLLLAAANRALAPGALEVSRFHFSWSGPTLLDGFALRDPQGELVVATSRAVWDRDLFHILFDGPRHGTLRLENARLDVERRSDGTIDLVETLGPILNDRRETDLTIQVVAGTLRLRSAGLKEPMQAKTLDFVVHRAAAPEPTSWTISLANSATETLKISGAYDRWGTSSTGKRNLRFQLDSRKWPLVVGSSRLAAKIRCDGSIRGGIALGLWSATGDLTFPELTVESTMVKPVEFPLRAAWNVEETASGWSLGMQISDPSGPGSDRTFLVRNPASVSARWTPTPLGLRWDHVSVDAGFLTAEGHGSAENEVDVAGTVDLAMLQNQFGGLIPSNGIELAGKGRFSGHFRPKQAESSVNASIDFPAMRLGPEDDAIVVGNSRFEASNHASGWNLGLGIASIEGRGFTVAPVRMDARLDHGKLAIEPITATLNGGKLRLVPELIEGQGGRILRLNEGTSLIDAEVNEQTSRRVLSFVAPILEGSTRARGYVSARIDRADFPLEANVAKTAVVQGEVVFRDLEFGPGPLAQDLLAILGRADAVMKLDQPVVLEIADGKIHQSGLAIPIGKLTKIEMEGTVGFDRTLDLRATLPLTTAMFPKGGLIGDIAAGTRFTIPIGGTLARPKIDKAALREGMADTGADLLRRGAAGLLFRLIQPRDDAQPRPSAEERKARRQELRAKRKADRAG